MFDEHRGDFLHLKTKHLCLARQLLIAFRLVAYPFAKRAGEYMSGLASASASESEEFCAPLQFFKTSYFSTKRK